MANLYADPSALVKRYAAEIGSAWLTAVVDPSSGNDVFSHQITAVEMIAALYLKLRTGAITLLELERDLQAMGSTPLLLISADQEQLRAARAEGLAVDDPNTHP